LVIILVIKYERCPELLWSFENQTSAGIKYGASGIKEHSERSGFLYENHIYIVWNRERNRG
jgi:hypothetical protein